MFKLFKKSVPPSPVWVYDSHEYVGVVDGSHGYVVTYHRGHERRTISFHFHCKSVDRVKDVAKLVKYFKSQANPE